MERTVYWTLPAVTDVENIRDFITRDSVRYAQAFVTEVFELSRTLRTFADRGRVVPELHESSLRELFLNRHRVIYEIYDDRVEIIAVVHMSRDLHSAWEERHPS
jgi:plasmid stabilization system protein ParE